MFLKLIIAYDGTPFIGWQENRDQPTIERHLKLALCQVLGQPVSLEGASRTDAGVHAEGQVVRAEFAELPERYTDMGLLQRGLNALLPSEIVVRQIEAVTAFHPSSDAKGKVYHYFVCQGPYQLPMHRKTSWHVPQELDLEVMEEGAKALIGTHDFAAFTNEAARYELKDSVRTLHSIELVRLQDNRLQFTVRGERFLFRMVRNIVGTLVDIGRGKLSCKAPNLLLESGDRTSAGVCAPARGLILHKVVY